MAEFNGSREKRKRQNRESQRRYRERRRAQTQRIGLQLVKRTMILNQKAAEEHDQSTTNSHPIDSDLSEGQRFSMGDYYTDSSNDSVYSMSEAFDALPSSTWSLSQNERKISSVSESPEAMLTANCSPRCPNLPVVDTNVLPPGETLCSNFFALNTQQQCAGACRLSPFDVQIQGEHSQDLYTFRMSANDQEMLATKDHFSPSSTTQPSLERRPPISEHNRTPSHSVQSPSSSLKPVLSHSILDMSQDAVVDRLISRAECKVTELEYLYRFGVSLGLLQEDLAVMASLETAKMWFVRASTTANEYGEGKRLSLDGSYDLNTACSW